MTAYPQGVCAASVMPLEICPWYVHGVLVLVLVVRAGRKVETRRCVGPALARTVAWLVGDWLCGKGYRAMVPVLECWDLDPWSMQPYALFLGESIPPVNSATRALMRATRDSIAGLKLAVVLISVLDFVTYSLHHSSRHPQFSRSGSVDSAYSAPRSPSAPCAQRSL